MNDRGTGAEAAVSSQNFFHSSKLGDSSRAHWAETTTIPAVGEVFEKEAGARAGLAAQHVELITKNKDLRFEADSGPKLPDERAPQQI